MSRIAVLALTLLATACGGGGELRPTASVTLPGGSSADCTVTVAPGGDVAVAVASAAPGAVICVPSGDYTLSTSATPLTAQTIHGVGKLAPTITCRAPLCFDGRGAGSDVTLANLILQGASTADVRTGDGWTVTQVSVQTAGEAGMKVQGTGVTISDVYAVSNGEFGIVAKDADGLTIDGATILDSPADQSFGIGFSGGLKLNSVSGATISRVDVKGGIGGAGIWLDNNTTGFAVSSSSVEGVAHDAIRVEISCNGTISTSTVRDAGNVGLDLYNSHDVGLSGNTVAAAGTWAIRMLSNGRSSGPGGGLCLQGGTFPSSGNKAENNAVNLGEGTLVGVDHQGGVTDGLEWTSNRYVAASCDAPIWTWWDGAAEASVGFAGWQNLGQDATGSCTAP